MSALHYIPGAPPPEYPADGPQDPVAGLGAPSIGAGQAKMETHEDGAGGDEAAPEPQAPGLRIQQGSRWPWRLVPLPMPQREQLLLG